MQAEGAKSGLPGSRMSASHLLVFPLGCQHVSNIVWWKDPGLVSALAQPPALWRLWQIAGALLLSFLDSFLKAPCPILSIYSFSHLPTTLHPRYLSVTFLEQLSASTHASFQSILHSSWSDHITHSWKLFNDFLLLLASVVSSLVWPISPCVARLQFTSPNYFSLRTVPRRQGPCTTVTPAPNNMPDI